MTMRENYAQLKIDKKKRTVVLKELQKLNLEQITAGVHAADGKQVVGYNGFKLIDFTPAVLSPITGISSLSYQSP